MQCLLRKRRLEPQLEPQLDPRLEPQLDPRLEPQLEPRLEPRLEPWSCSAKRLRVEVEVHSPECPMDISSPFAGPSQQDQQQVSAIQPRPALCCPRCLSGEPGHINHIVSH